MQISLRQPPSGYVRMYVYRYVTVARRLFGGCLLAQLGDEPDGGRSPTATGGLRRRSSREALIAPRKKRHKYSSSSWSSRDLIVDILCSFVDRIAPFSKLLVMRQQGRFGGILFVYKDISPLWGESFSKLISLELASF